MNRLTCLLSLFTLACADAGPDSEAHEPAEAATPEPARPATEKSDDPWAWLCQDIAESSDGVCTEQCVEYDPDCGSETDRCEVHGYYGDGVCDRRCERPDPDCDEEGPDACLDEYRYADGACDADCAHPDPDCADEPGPDALADWEVTVCARFRIDPADGRLVLQELATSLCIERTGLEQVHCIAHCVRAYWGE